MKIKLVLCRVSLRTLATVAICYSLFLVEFVAPVPGTRQTAVNAGAGVIKIVGARTIKGMFEEVLIRKG